MQLESHATPPSESPAQRYASLHRAIDRGLESDEIWRELAEVCQHLGLSDEAVRCVRRVHSDSTRLWLEQRLLRQQRNRTSATPAASHSAAPAASDAGTTVAHEASDRALGVLPAPRLHGLGEHLVDAVHYLGQQQMPWLVLLTTLAFPLIVGFGGFLTAGDSPWLLGALAALPGLLVLALVGAMSRRILLASSQGNSDVPAVGGLLPLCRDAGRFGADTALVMLWLLGPAAITTALAAPWTTTLPVLAIGAFFLPLGFGLRQLRGDLGALSPLTLLRGAARTDLSYAILAGICLLLFAPAALATILMAGRPVWVQIAALGPLCVLPLFACARLLGTWIDAMRLELGALLQPAAASAKPSQASAPAATEPAEPAQPRTPQRPAALRHYDAPPATAKPRQRQRQRPTAVASKPKVPATPAKPPTQPQTQPQTRAIEGRAPAREATTTPGDGPDLRHMPGAVVVSGKDRVRHGAAARPR